jgi:ornithine carbamoyltransferase
VKRDLLSIRNLSGAEILDLIAVARNIKADPTKYAQTLKGKSLALIFEKPSLRTRVSFDIGIHQMGGFSIYLTPAEIDLGKRESIYDVAKNLERMVQGIVMRTFSHRVVEQMAEAAAIPVINGLTDYSHPCQALADYMTIQEIKGDLRGIRVAYVGDGNNVAHSLIYGAVRVEANLVVATPRGYEPDSSVIHWASERRDAHEGRVSFTSDPVAAVSGADVVYTDVWASMGHESEANQRREIFLPYQVNEDLFSHARADALFMHCLPAHRGEEVSSDIMDSPHSVVYQQAENRLHSQKAILLSLMGEPPVLGERWHSVGFPPA